MKYLLILLLYLLSFEMIFSQKKEKTTSLPYFQTSDAGCEKVYLHTDRSFYFAGDDIWFKAYLADAYTNNLVNSSNILYVELISPDSEIILRKVVQLNDGVGNGDFHINENISPGQYQLRVYTNLMRNFNDQFFFNKTLIIESTAKEGKPEKGVLQKESQIDIQFFPEGGSFVDNVQVVVGFKAISSSGYSCDVAGSIISSQGDTITEFRSTHLGMGSFYLTPVKGLTYFAAGKAGPGMEFRASLPGSFNTGIAMKESSPEDERLLISIFTNQETLPSLLNENLKLEIHSQNLLRIYPNLKITALRNSFDVSVKEVPEGISRLTISDKSGRSLCERLVYIHHKPDINFSIRPDKMEYTPRSPVSLNISLTDTSGKNVPSFASLSVTDASVGKNLDLYQSDIASYFLLESEIAGNIEQPGYYFDRLNRDRIKDLDLLLLTQGWRDFKWKYIPDSVQIINQPESGFAVSGKLTKLLNNKPLPSANISLVLMTLNGYYYSAAKTGVSGDFAFHDLRFPGKAVMVISASDEEFKPNGFLRLDSVIRSYPIVEYGIIQRRDVAPEEIVNLKNEVTNIEMIKKKYSLKDTILLNEVVVTAKKTDVKKNGVPQVYNNPDYVLKVDEKSPVYPNIFLLMQGQIPGVAISGSPPNVRVSIRGAGEPLYLLDGTPVDFSTVSGISVSEVDRIDVLKTPSTTAVFGMKGGNGVISVITKRGVEGSKSVSVPYSINKTISGFDPTRKFYSPVYDKPDQEARIPDLRITIFWEPYITRGNDTITVVRYFNSEKSTTVIIRAEGITRDGIPVTASARYLVR